MYLETPPGFRLFSTDIQSSMDTDGTVTWWCKKYWLLQDLEKLYKQEKSYDVSDFEEWVFENVPLKTQNIADIDIWRQINMHIYLRLINGNLEVNFFKSNSNLQ